MYCNIIDAKGKEYICKSSGIKQQSLECLGDSIVFLSACNYITKCYPTIPVGTFNDYKRVLISTPTLAFLAEHEFGLPVRTAKLMEDSFEISMAYLNVNMGYSFDAIVEIMFKIYSEHRFELNIKQCFKKTLNELLMKHHIKFKWNDRKVISQQPIKVIGSITIDGEVHIGNPKTTGLESELELASRLLDEFEIVN